MKQELNRLGTDGFEHLVQALMAARFGFEVKIYGDGPDRQREAVIEDADCQIVGTTRALGRTIVQAKYKSPDGNKGDLPWLKGMLKKELDGFAEERETNPDFIPNTWLFFTNVVLTPGKGGIKDEIDEYVKGWGRLIPYVYILGPDEIRSLLDAYPDVARRYAAFISPSDVLAETFDHLDQLKREPLEGLVEYVLQRFRADEPVRLEQAGSVAEESIKIQNVYIDLEAEGRLAGKEDTDGLANTILRLGDLPHPRSFNQDKDVSEDNVVVLGNAGQGKSTICQYICQLYRASILKRFRPGVASAHDYAKQSGIEPPKRERFPFLIRLKDYAAWIRRRQGEEKNYTVLSYLAIQIENEGNTRLGITSMKELLGAHPCLFVFDGLDEVPASSNRNELLMQIDSFIFDDLIETHCDGLVICTSRPQGYDAAFSPLLYRHVELIEMSPECCMRYVDRLLNYLEQSPEYREKYRGILAASLEDKLVAKLMTTPLYTAILVLLVKSGSKPPTRRYELFSKYCEIVEQRELQKDLLPSLYDGDYAWIKEVHGLIAYLLQMESETSENAAAELSTERCIELIKNYLCVEQWTDDKGKKAEELYHAMTGRLPFLVETTDTDGDSCVLFPLRSLQEYFAAEHLLRIEDPEKRREMLEALSLSVYWRNVFLFVAGYYSNKDSYVVNDSIYTICKRNNGDQGFSNWATSNWANACSIALPGSRLALDLLCDNLFERRGGQDRYLELTARLLSWDSFGPHGSAFTKLPLALRQHYVCDEAARCVSSTLSPESIAFELLIEEAQRGNSKARQFLEDLADKLVIPLHGTTDNNIRRFVFGGIGPKLDHFMFEWLVNDCSNYRFLPRGIFVVLEQYAYEEDWQTLPNAVRRIMAYETLLHSFRRSVSEHSKLEELCRNDEFLNAVDRIVKNDAMQYVEFCMLDDLQREGISAFHFKPENASAWKELEQLAEQCDFMELKAMAAFYRKPCAEKLKNLIATCQQLTNHAALLFSALKRRGLLFSIVFHDCQESMNTGNNSFEYCDEAYFRSVLELDKSVTDAVKKRDYAKLNELNAWKYLDNMFINLEPWVPEAIRATDDESCAAVMSMIGRYDLTSSEFSDDDFLQAVLQRFPVAFHRYRSSSVALEVFSRVPMKWLVTPSFEYPRCLPKYASQVSDAALSLDVLKRVRRLVELGDSHLNAYSLLPFVFRCADFSMLNEMSRVASDVIDRVKETGNDCALLGAILLILTDENPKGGGIDIYSELSRLMREGEFDLWSSYYRRFSLNGQLLAYRAGMSVYEDTREEKSYCNAARNMILERLGASPADHSKLPAPGDPACFLVKED